jgi:hypothetical protein
MNEEIFKSILGKFNEGLEACECKEKQDNKKNTDKILFNTHKVLSKELDNCHRNLVCHMQTYIDLVKEMHQLEAILKERSGDSNDD